MILALLAGFAVMALTDMKSLVKTENKAAPMTVYFLLLALGLFVSILLTLEEPPASPSVVIEKIVDFVLAR